MQREEALALLQVDAGADPQGLKRAYLRQVKQHPPERDPLAFERIRQAYELLTNPVYLLFDESGDEELWGQDESSNTAVSNGATSDPGVEPNVGEADVSVVRIRSQAFDALSAKLQQERVTIVEWVELLRDCKRDERDEACGLVNVYLWTNDRGYEVSALSSMAYKLGLDGLEGQYLSHTPGSLSSEQLLELEQRPEHEFLAERELARRGNKVIGERYRAELRGALVSQAPVDVRASIQAVLGLQIAGRRKLARSLVLVLSKYIDATGAGTTLDAHSALLLRIGLELSRLPAEAAPFVRIVAQPLRDGDPAAAEEPILALVEGDRQLAERLYYDVYQNCPTLHRLFERNLRPRASGTLPVGIAVLLWLVPVGVVLAAHHTTPRLAGPTFAYVFAGLFVLGGFGGIAYAAYLGLLRLRAHRAQRSKRRPLQANEP